MSAAGSYVSISGALSDADEGIKHVLKMGLITRRPEKSSVENNELESISDTGELLNNYVDAAETSLDKDSLKSKLRELYAEAQNLEIV